MSSRNRGFGFYRHLDGLEWYLLNQTGRQVTYLSLRGVKGNFKIKGAMLIVTIFLYKRIFVNLGASTFTPEV